MARTEADSKATAVHEAAHAVMAQELGHGVKEVSIIPSDDSHGHCLRYSRPAVFRRVNEGAGIEDAFVRRELEARILIHYAGGIAESLYSGQSLNMEGMGLADGETQCAPGSDYDHITDFFGLMAQDEYEAWTN
jgi:ATP-dependent Zn protease